MAMSFEHLNASPAFLPVPELDGHVIGSGQDKGLRRVDCNRANVVWVRLERGYLFGGIVVVDANLKVIRTADDPVLPGDETASSHRDIGEFEGSDD